MNSQIAAVTEPLSRDLRFRVEMTVGCRDAASVPKVPGAGIVVRDDKTDVQLMHNGLRVVAGGYYGSWMTEIIQRLGGHHEPQEELVFHEIMKFMPGAPVMIELGCFWAYYSLWMLQAHPRARVIGVEPDPNNLEIGRRNAALNGRTMSFVQASVGGRSIEARPFVAETAGSIDLPQIAVPDLMAEHGLAALDLLHCDTQGAETEILMSCRPLLESGAIRFCIVSTHHHAISGDPLTHQRCLAIIAAAGGRILAEHSVAESFSGDGLIAAYFGKEPIPFPELKLSYNRASTSLFRDPLFDLAECRTRIDDAGPNGSTGSGTAQGPS